MIIGIAGKAGSGKDLVGSIIQYLIACKKYEGMDCFKADYVNKGFNLEDDYTDISEWKIKKFADPLKDIVCILLGCNRKQLEDREFKEKELGEEWWQYGVIRKNTKNPIFISFSLEEAQNQLLLFNNSTLYINKLTPRKLLQLIGTECGRQIIHPDIWVNAVMRRYNNTFKVEEREGEFTWGRSESFWIITDVRFPNEIKAIKDEKGIIIKVNRFPKEILNQAETLDKKHISENSLNTYEGFDYNIDNNGTIEELINKVKEILIKEKII